eukprot:3913862-Alexandrium_andersonii.AAC.1
MFWGSGGSAIDFAAGIGISAKSAAEWASRGHRGARTDRSALVFKVRCKARAMSSLINQLLSPLAA